MAEPLVEPLTHDPAIFSGHKTVRGFKSLEFWAPSKEIKLVFWQVFRVFSCQDCEIARAVIDLPIA